MRRARAAFVIGLTAIAWAGCSTGKSVTLEQAYAGRALEGGVLAVPAFGVELGPETEGIFPDAEAITDDSSAVVSLVKEHWQDQWKPLTYLDSLIFTSEHDAAKPFRITMVDPTRPGSRNPKTIAVPTDGTTLTYGGFTPDYVLLLEDVWVGEVTTAVRPSGPTGITTYVTKYVTRGEYALWDNREGRLVQRGRHLEEADPPGMFSGRSEGEAWEQGLSGFVEHILAATPLGPMAGGEPMPPGAARRDAVEAYRAVDRASQETAERED